MPPKREFSSARLKTISRSSLGAIWYYVCMYNNLSLPLLVFDLLRVIVRCSTTRIEDGIRFRLSNNIHFIFSDDKANDANIWKFFIMLVQATENNVCVPTIKTTTPSRQNYSLPDLRNKSKRGVGGKYQNRFWIHNLLIQSQIAYRSAMAT